jgi:putative transposase
MTKQVNSAFTKFFREKGILSKFKSKRNPIQSFLISQHYNLDFENDTLSFLRSEKSKQFFTKHLKGVQNRYYFGVSTERYYISILVEDSKEFPVKKMSSGSTTIGLEVMI